MLPNYSHHTISELHQSAEHVRAAIAAKLDERQALTSDIQQLKDKIANLSEALAFEGHRQSSASILNQPTMTAAEFIASRKTLEALKAELPPLLEGLAFLDRAVEALHDELRTVNNWIGRKVEHGAKDEAARLAADLVAQCGDELKAFVSAVIASQGEQLSEERAKMIIGRSLLAAMHEADGYIMPDIGDAFGAVADRLNTVAQAA